VKLDLDIQVACTEPVPGKDEIQLWVEAALAHTLAPAEISVRLVSETEMSSLNQQYRDKNGSTNVLSFPADLPAELELPLLGDIVICPAVVAREAAEQNKSLTQHWAHMLVHGSLHLLGYDHIDAAQADIMEPLETTLLQALGYPCPYTGEIATAKAGAQ